MRFNKLILAATMCGITVATPANALQIIIFNDGGHSIGSAAYKSFEVAASYWESILTDDVRVNIVVKFSNISAGSIAGSQGTIITASVDRVYAALADDSTSAVDASVVSNLQPLTQSTNPSLTGLGSLTVIGNGLSATGKNYVDETTRIDNDGSQNNTFLQVNYANAEALGIVSDYQGNAIDDTISYANIAFSSKMKFDYDPTDGIDDGSYDYTGIAIREIAVALGLQSNLETYDFYTTPYMKNAAGNLEGKVVSKTYDLFRYSDVDTIDWSTSSATKYFSIDGGESQVFGSSEVGKGLYNGDGVQANYWLDDESGQSVGIMDKNVATGTGLSVTALDLVAIDAIGWDLNYDILTNSDYSMSTADIYRAMTAVPEPSTWLQMLTGFGLIGAVARRRRPKMTLA